MTTVGSVGTGGTNPNAPKTEGEGLETLVMKGRAGVRNAARFATVCWRRSGVASYKRPRVGRKEGWWAKVPSKMVNSLVGAITSSRLIRADFSAKKAACVRKPVPRPMPRIGDSTKLVHSSRGFHSIQSSKGLVQILQVYPYQSVNNYI